MAEIIALPKSATFDDFWKACPKRIDKAMTIAKWNAITGGGLKTKALDRDSGTYIDLELKATPEELIKAMSAYSRAQYNSMTGDWRDGGKYIMGPATWLNRGRWMD